MLFEADFLICYLSLLEIVKAWVGLEVVEDIFVGRGFVLEILMSFGRGFRDQKSFVGLSINAHQVQAERGFLLEGLWFQV